MPRLTTDLRNFLVMHREIVRHQLDPFRTVILVSLARAAFRAGERKANGGPTAEYCRNAVKEQAGKMGIDVTWPGLWPVFTKDGEEVRIPF